MLKSLSVHQKNLNTDNGNRSYSGEAKHPELRAWRLQSDSSPRLHWADRLQADAAASKPAIPSLLDPGGDSVSHGRGCTYVCVDTIHDTYECLCIPPEGRYKKGFGAAEACCFVFESLET
jgi:hypothetical protein